MLQLKWKLYVRNIALVRQYRTSEKSEQQRDLAEKQQNNLKRGAIREC